MFSLKPQQPSVIGLDIGRLSIKAVQITPHDKGPRLDGAVCLKRESAGAGLSAGEAHRLSRAMDRRAMNAGRVVLVAPTEALVGGTIALPPADAEVSRDKLVQTELSRTHELMPGTFEFAWWDLPPASGARVAQAHAVALPHSSVEPALARINEMGLEVVRTVPTSLALLAAAQRRPIDPRRIAAVLDLGSRKAHLVLMHAGRVVHERPLPDFDMNALRAEVIEELGVNEDVAQHAMARFGVRDEPDGAVACTTTSVIGDAANALSEEIGMSFAYVSHLYPEAELGPLLLTGGGANVPGLTITLANLLELEAATIRPTELLTGECFSSDCSDPALTAAAGAAITGGGDA